MDAWWFIKRLPFSFLPSSSSHFILENIITVLLSVLWQNWRLILPCVVWRLHLVDKFCSVNFFPFCMYFYFNYINFSISVFLLLLKFLLSMILLCSIFIFLLICGDVKSNPGPHHTRRWNCHILYSNIRGLHANIYDLTVSSNHCDILCCSETLVSQMRHILVLLSQVIRNQFC